MRVLKSILFLGCSFVLTASSVQAQSIDEALELYRSKQWADASFAFYDVLQKDSNPDTRDKAEIYLAETLYKQELYYPALYYYSDMFKIGRSNRYYLNAVEGLLKVQEALRDWVIVPSLVNENLDPEGFSQLDGDKIARVNYMIGQLSFAQRKNEDAKAFLEYVAPESNYHAKARYLQGILEVRGGDAEAGLGHFEAVLDIVPSDSPNSDLLDTRGLALVAAGRAAYGLGRYAESAAYYSSVPRFSRHWFTAMYESAWTYYKKEAYGKALGELHSITSPFFEKRFVPEAFVIQGITYFINCQWDRVRRAVGLYKDYYEPILANLGAYLAEANRDPVEYYRDLVAGGGPGKYSVELAREIRRTKRFLDYHYMLEHIRWEADQVKNNAAWRGTQLADDLLITIEQTLEGVEPLVGTWIKRLLTNAEAGLKNFQSQIEILDFEVTDAEAEWLAQGREILKGRRRRLPRPEIPNDQWQHWNFDGEYWKGELGYFHHSIRSECE